MASTPPVDPNGSVATTGIDFPAAQRSTEFQRLRSTHRSFVFPLAVAFLVWYLPDSYTHLTLPTTPYV